MDEDLNMTWRNTHYKDDLETTQLKIRALLELFQNKFDLLLDDVLIVFFRLNKNDSFMCIYYT